MASKIPLSPNSTKRLLSTFIFALASIILSACNQSAPEDHHEKRDKSRDNKISSANYISYMARLGKQIKRHWLPETGSGKSGAVLFSTSRSGKVSDLKISRSSGDPDFDNAMLNTITAAQPLPPLPLGAPLIVPVEFTFNNHVYSQIVTTEPAEVRQAIARIDQSIAAKATSDLYFERAKLWLQVGEKDKASADFSRAVADGGSIEIWSEKAKVDSRRGNYKDCLSDCEQILKINHGNNLQASQLEAYQLQAHVLQSESYLNLGHLNQALAAANNAIAASPSHPDGYTARAYAENLSANYRSAIDDCNSALALDPQCSAAYAYRGDAEEELKQYDRALKDYGKTVELNPLDAGALLRRAELHNQIGQFHRAIIDCTDAIKLDADNGEAYFYRSYANAQLALSAQAKKDRDRAEALGFVGQ